MIKNNARRRFLAATATAVPWVGLNALAIPETNAFSSNENGDNSKSKKKKVAAIVTIYRKFSHTDVLIGKILEGWEQKGGAGPDLELASLFVDQFPKDDMAKKMSSKHGFPIFESIEDALTLGTQRIAVDGVLSIGEHGDYPWNKLGQHLYPRKRFFKEITDAFEKFDRVVPVFNDKHPGPVWKDARWMFDRATELKVPFMAGSSLPVSYRKPDFDLKLNSKIESCLAIGYSGLDIYGFHTLEFLQCVIERRKTKTQAVKSVQCLPGNKIKGLLENGTIKYELLEYLLKVTPNSGEHLLKAKSELFNVFLIEYADGLVAPVLMLPGFAKGISVAYQTDDGTIEGGLTEERREPYFPHFACLLKGIEKMIHTGKATYPVERTMLTAGILDRVLHSKSDGFKKRMTPELDFNYKAIDYPHGDGIKL